MNAVIMWVGFAHTHNLRERYKFINIHPHTNTFTWSCSNSCTFIGAIWSICLFTHVQHTCTYGVCVVGDMNEHKYTQLWWNDFVFYLFHFILYEMRENDATAPDFHTYKHTWIIMWLCNFQFFFLLFRHLIEPKYRT